MERIINQCDICHIAINDSEGSPYLIPMNFAYNQGDIILHSAPFGNHINLLKQDNRITVSFTTHGQLVYQHLNVACSYRMNSESVVCKGKLNFVDDLIEKEQLLNIFMRKYSDKAFKYSEPALRNVKVWVIKCETMTAKAFGQPHMKA